MAKNKGVGILAAMKSELLGGLRAQYFNIATNIYKWKNMPDEIPIRYPERWLYENGMCVFLEVPNAGYACLPVATGSIENNMYGEPAKWKAVAVGKYSGIVSSLDLNAENSVLIRNDFKYQPTMPYVDVLIKQLVNVEMTMRLNINAQKNPMWFHCNDENVLQSKNTFMEYFESEPVFFKDGLSANEFEFINPNIPYIGNELSDTYNVYEYRIMSYLGIDNNGVDKKERMLVSESEANNDKIMMIRNSRLEQRKLACEQINDIFGLDVSVEVSEDLNSEQDDYANGAGNQAAQGTFGGAGIYPAKG